MGTRLPFPPRGPHQSRPCRKAQLEADRTDPILYPHLLSAPAMWMPGPCGKFRIRGGPAPCLPSAVASTFQIRPNPEIWGEMPKFLQFVSDGGTRLWPPDTSLHLVPAPVNSDQLRNFPVPALRNKRKRDPERPWEVSPGRSQGSKPGVLGPEVSVWKSRLATTGCYSELSRMVLEDPAAVTNKIVQKEKKRPNKHNYNLSTTPHQPPRSGDLVFATQLEQRGWARRGLGTTAPYLPRAWVMASGPPYNLIKRIRLTEPPGWLDLPPSEGSLGPRQEQKPPGYSSLSRSGPASSRGLGGPGALSMSSNALIGIFFSER